MIRQEKVLGFGGLVGHDAREVARGLPREVLARAPRSSIDVLPAHVAELVRGESEAGQRWHQAIDLYRQGAAALERRDPEAAVALFDRAVSSLERAGVKKGVAAIHAHAAAALAALSDPREAAARLERARAALAGGDPAGELVVTVFEAAVGVVEGGAVAAAHELLDRATRAELGTPELAFATRVLERALSERRSAGEPEGARPAAKLDGGRAFVVGAESRWMIPPGGARVDLVRYGPVRRLLDGLVVARLEQPGAALSAEALIEAGWPGERMRHSAGLLRVYSAVRRLRRLGLESILITRDDGYLLDPAATVIRRRAATKLIGFCSMKTPAVLRRHVLLAGLAVLVAVSCKDSPKSDPPASGAPGASSSGSKRLKIAVVPKGTTHEFWKSVHAGAVKASKELDVDIVWKGPLKEDDLKAQIDVVNTFVAQGVSGICRGSAERQRAPLSGEVCGRRRRSPSSSSTRISRATIT